MKRIFAPIIGGLAVVAVIWAQPIVVQLDPSHAETGPLAAMPMDDDDQFRGRMRGPGGFQGVVPPGMTDQLELTDAQQEKMKSLRSAFEKDAARLRAELEVAQIELREVMEQTNPSASDARSKAQKVSEARARLFERTVAFQVEMKNVLTPEQQKKAEELRQQMRPRRGRRFDMRRGPHGGQGFMR